MGVIMFLIVMVIVIMRLIGTGPASFKLNGRFPNSVMLLKPPLQELQRLIGRRAVAHSRMQGQAELVRRQLPDLDAVNIFNIGGLPYEIGRKGVSVNVMRRAFKQDMRRLAQEL